MRDYRFIIIMAAWYFIPVMYESTSCLTLALNIKYMPTRRLIIKGKVQGVFYRATAKDIADEIGINGWIRNTEAGDVEALVSGDEEQLQQFIQWCRQGPGKASVADVIIQEEAEKTFAGFLVKR